MDPAAAGLVGAGIGGLAGLATSLAGGGIAAWATARRDRWERRQDVYAAYLTALNAFLFKGQWRTEEGQALVSAFSRVEIVGDRKTCEEIARLHGYMVSAEWKDAVARGDNSVVIDRAALIREEVVAYMRRDTGGGPLPRSKAVPS